MEGTSGDHLVQTPAQSRANFKFGFRALSSQILNISREQKSHSLSRQRTSSKATTYLQSPLLQDVHISIWRTTPWESLCWLSIVLVILVKIAPQPLTIWPALLSELLEIRKKSWTQNQHFLPSGRTQSHVTGWTIGLGSFPWKTHGTAECCGVLLSQPFWINALAFFYQIFSREILLKKFDTISKTLPHSSHLHHGTLSSCTKTPISSVHEAVAAVHKVLGRSGLSAEWGKTDF